MNNKVNLIDCTLRDGGYYNNWNFSKNLINNYLSKISKTQINNVEIGFLTIPEDKNKGFTANCNKDFFQQVLIPKNINCGIMINGSDLIGNKSSSFEIYKNLKQIDKKNVKFVRFACHLYEVLRIKKYLNFLKKRGFKIFVNIMQISEIKKIQIKKICSELELNCDVVYIADSLGALNKNSTRQILNDFKKYINKPLGVHTHDNMGKALENSIIAYKSGAKWIDGTIQGMGRGPGNVKTEDLIKYFYKKNSDTYREINDLSKTFKFIKKKYKWGTNIYYSLSGKYRIHPTYIQMILSDSRYKSFHFKKIIKNLKALNAKKYNPNTLFLAMNFFNSYNKKHITNNVKLKFKKNVIIFGNGKSLKNEIKKDIFHNSTKILINRSNYISEKKVDLLAFCHPLRLITDINLIKDKNKTILLPYNTIPKIIKDKITNQNLINFDLKLGLNIKLSKNYITIPKPLTLIYTLGFLISSGVTKVFLAGFDGFESDDPFKDETQTYINKLKQISKKLKIISLTKTKYKF